jgi:amino acid adenylation domain-containing protein
LDVLSGGYEGAGSVDAAWIPMSHAPRDPQGGALVFPLSFAQQRLWFLDRLTPGKWYYNIPAGTRIHSRVSTRILQRCVDEMVQRHESLRTVFRSDDGTAVQVVLPSVHVPVQTMDISTLPLDQREAELIRLAGEEARRSFDLDRGPLMRVTLIRLNDAEHVLLITMHHIISDGWSLSVFSRELGALYEAYAGGRPSPLAPPAIQYADYALWQRQWLSGEIMEEQLAWWRNRLAGLEPLRMWTDHPRPSIATFAGAFRTTTLGTDLNAALHALARRQRCTLFMTLLAGFIALLSRYTQQDEIVVGTPIAGRNRPETEPVIGFFVNTLVLRANLAGDPSFHELLRRVREMALDAWAHQDLPFEKLVEELHPRRDLSRNPLFQVAFQLLNTDGVSAETADVWRDVHFGVAKFDLTFNLWESAENINCQIEYSTNLYNASSVERMAQHFRTLLKSAVGSPDTPISRLNLLTSSEIDQALADWHAGEPDYSRERSVNDLFRERAAIAPETPAVEYGSGAADPPMRLTYAALDRRSSQLANLLIGLGVRAGDSVGLLLAQSSGLVTAMLAVLKTGAAYVPMDVSFPATRVRQILDDCQAKVLVAASETDFGSQGYHAGTRILCLDAAADALDRQLSVAPPNVATGESVAYIMYTSGSTSVPKGARIPHRAISRLVINTNYIAASSEDRFAQVSNPAFDAATFEIWGALLNGGCIVGIGRDTLLSPLKFASEVRQLRITSMFLTTALFNMLARATPWAFQPVKNVLFGGEMADAASVSSILRNGAPARLVHVYGPTENTTFSLWDLISELDECATSVPLGRPIANTKAVILDRNMQPVPTGCPGELCLGGDGLALDYLNRPELTASCFVQWRCPGTAGAAERVYRTGDLVKRLPDGRIEFLGRMDRMVKIRGFRVEPGELETLLAEHALVRECAVIARAAGPGAKRLLAYVTLRESTPAEQAVPELRKYLREHVPEFTIPAAFVVIPEMPLNLNGKVDRAALANAAPEDAEAPASFTAPANDIEERLAEIWREALRVPRVGTHDNFFDIGGHSLLLIEVHGRIERRFGPAVSITDLFRYPTIASLAEHLKLARGPKDAGAAEPTERGLVEDAVERAWRQKLAIRQRTRGAGA